MVFMGKKDQYASMFGKMRLQNWGQLGALGHCLVKMGSGKACKVASYSDNGSYNGWQLHFCAVLRLVDPR